MFGDDDQLLGRRIEEALDLPATDLTFNIADDASAEGVALGLGEDEGGGVIFGFVAAVKVNGATVRCARLEGVTYTRGKFDNIM